MVEDGHVPKALCLRSVCSCVLRLERTALTAKCECGCDFLRSDRNPREFLPKSQNRGFAILNTAKSSSGCAGFTIDLTACEGFSCEENC